MTYLRSWLKIFITKAGQPLSEAQLQLFLYLGKAMKYEKPWKSIDEQAKLLTDGKGLVCADRASLERALLEIGYYRLSAYWFPYKILGEDGRTRFRDNTTLEMILRSYEFDRRLRLLMFDAIGKIEIYLRSRLAYLASQEYGEFGYPEAALPRLKKEYSAAKRNEQYIKHFVTKYGDSHELPPYWMMTECLTMGAIELLYTNASSKTRSIIASELGVKVRVLRSWISVLRAARNACCHHSRVWNRTWGVKPVIPNAWKGFKGPNDKTYAVLSVLAYMLERTCGSTQWTIDLDKLLSEFKDIPACRLGFFDGWKETDPWVAL